VKIARKEDLSEAVAVAAAVVVSVETVAALVATAVVATVVVVRLVIAEIAVTIINTNKSIYLCFEEISMKYPDEESGRKGSQRPLFLC
jgi:hypothetical protein